MKNDNANYAFTFCQNYISGDILVFRGLEKNKPEQAENVAGFGFRTICIIWAGVIDLGKLQITLEPLTLAYCQKCFYVL